MTQAKDPLHGVTLEAILVQLHARFGWDGLAERVDVRCFSNEPSIKSSLKFLRKTQNRTPVASPLTSGTTCRCRSANTFRPLSSSLCAARLL